MAVAPLPDPDGFEELYREHATRVYRYALAVLRNPADAEDVTQVTFMNAYRALQNGTRPEKPENWLLRIAHNACRTRFVRAARRPQEVPLDDRAREVPAPEAERPNIRAVLRELARLPFNQRSALVMRELEGRTYEEIAEALDVSVPAVETLLFRARRSLKLRRSAIRALGAVQLPSSLESLFSSGAGAGAGAIAGGGALLKVAALVAAAVTAGSAGYEAVIAKAGKPRAHAVASAPLPVLEPDSLGSARSGGPAQRAHDPQAPRRAASHRAAAATRTTGANAPGSSTSVSAAAVPAGAGAGTAAAPAPDPAVTGAAAAAPAQQPAPPPTETVTQTVSSAPSLPPAPALPAAPALPPVSAPPAAPSPPTVSVPTVTVPAPPDPPKLPKLP